MTRYVLAVAVFFALGALSPTAASAHGVPVEPEATLTADVAPPAVVVTLAEKLQECCRLHGDAGCGPAGVIMSAPPTVRVAAPVPARYSTISTLDISGVAQAPPLPPPILS